MSNLRIWGNGLGPATGERLVIEKPLLLTDIALFVDFASGNDANAGNYQAPFKTLAAAVTASADEGTIVLLPTHDETIASPIAIAKADLTIVGSGLSGGIPTSVLRNGCGGASAMLTFSLAANQVIGVRFGEATVASTGRTVAVSGARFKMRGCYFEQGNLDRGYGIATTSAVAGFTVEETQFVSTATLLATRPIAAISTLNATTFISFDGVTVDGGTVGYSAGGITIGSGAVPLRAERMSLLRSAYATVATGSHGYWNDQLFSGGSLVDWTS